MIKNINYKALNRNSLLLQSILIKQGWSYGSQSKKTHLYSTQDQAVPVQSVFLQITLT